MRTRGYQRRREIWPRLVAKFGIPIGLLLATIQGNGWWPTYDTVSSSSTLNSGSDSGSTCGAEGMAAIRATIREKESKGDYAAVNSGSGRAAGAYQFVTDTWNGHRGYATADAAPPEVQDERADQYINDALGKAGGDVAMVGPFWYLGHVPSPAEMDQIPAAWNGNNKTVRQYQWEWMTIYERFRQPCQSNAVLPVPRETITKAFEEHHDYPALDISVPTGTPVYAVVSGDAEPIELGGDCGWGVSIKADSGQWNYCHGSALTNASGKVDAGTQIMVSGNTGTSTGPHLHIQIQTPRGYACPHQLISALLANQKPPEIDSLPTTRPCV